MFSKIKIIPTYHYLFDQIESIIIHTSWIGKNLMLLSIDKGLSYCDS